MEGSLKKNMNKNIDTFNKWAKEDKDKSMQLNHTASVEEMFKIIHNETDKLKYPFKFLDLGCGNGWVIRKALEHSNCKFALGIDNAENMINKALKHKKGNFITGNIEDYSYKGRFDIIFSMETMYYINNIEKSLNNIFHKGLKDDGIMIMGIDHYKENESSLNWSKDYNLDMKTLSINEWKDEFLNFGFKKITHYQYGKKKEWSGTLIILAQK